MARFVVNRQLRFGDCDPSGMAYFPSYLNILDGVVEEFWTEIGHPWKAQIRDRGIGTPTAHLSCDFVAPSGFGDELTFTLSILRIGRSSLELWHDVASSGEPRWSARQVLVLARNDTRRATAWPDDIRAALEQFMESPDA